VDPYWRVRALLYTFSLNPLGDKKTLLRRVESLLFEKYLYKRSGDEELREISDIEIETLINSSKIEFSPKEQKHYSEWEAAIREGTQFFSLPSTEPNSRKVEFLVHRGIEFISNM
jgi:hypothetical protein